ncbi:hypothetical protein KKD03_04470 [Patescibacteria group bacterium]|nr:hypothetical protein [Patescibacteria group bacterium]
MIVFILFFLTLLIYAIFSYSLVDPNLVLTSNACYWSFQNWMWSTFFHNGHLMAYVYFGIIISLFVLYFHILEKLKSKQVTLKKIFKNKYVLLFLALIFPIFLSYNALSHDVFNYIFDARMIVKYGVDSRMHVPLDFPNDLWIRFMHNTHVTDVYGRGWTYSSIIPYILGLGKFSLTLVMFRAWSFFSLILLYLSMHYFSRTLINRNMNLYETSLVFLNPLLLIEVISNYHNDILMMPFAVLAVSLLIKPITSKITNDWLRAKYIVFSLLALAISISIKMATVALSPIWLLVIGASYFSFKFMSSMATKFKIKIDKSIYEKLILSFFEKFVGYVPDLVAGLMMILLFTPRSNYFLPWYMIWVIVWIPFMKSKLFRNLIIVFTFSSCLRYLPWLFNNLEYTDLVLKNQKLITWIIPGIYLFTRLDKIGQKINRS